uniref:Ig-like domain-containing protein n=1 Tax=Scleropages formosus TaxID=113540 RepID=A0A8C9RK74_SCLFO
MSWAPIPGCRRSTCLCLCPPTVFICPPLPLPVHVPLTVFLSCTPSAPTVDPVPVGDRVKLPCYAPINRQTEDSQLNVRWEKEGKVVLHLHSGSVTLGSGFENRVSVSKEDIRKGDLSLVFNTTLFSDHGSYRCFYNKEKTDNLTVSEGDSITLPLHSTEPVRVQFSSAGDQSTGVSVCVVEGGLPRCETQYKHRVSIQNGSLHLQQASPSDRGVYRVMDHRTNDIISIFSVDLIEGMKFLFVGIFKLNF